MTGGLQSGHFTPAWMQPVYPAHPPLQPVRTQGDTRPVQANMNMHLTHAVSGIFYS